LEIVEQEESSLKLHPNQLPRMYHHGMRSAKSQELEDVAAMKVCNEYILDNAPLVINLPSTMRESLTSWYEQVQNRTRSNHAQTEMFAEAEHEILLLLARDSFTRFVLTREYDKLKSGKLQDDPKIATV
jgi:hypothetical protein